MDELVFHHWVKVIIYLYNHQHDERIMTLWRMSKDLNISSGASVAKIIKLFIRKNLLKVERKGRTNKYILTPKGLRIAEYLGKVKEEA